MEVWDDGTMIPEPLLLGEWLASKPDAFVRAFLARWDSSKFAPAWVAFKGHPKAVRARAVVRRS